MLYLVTILEWKKNAKASKFGKPKGINNNLFSDQQKFKIEVLLRLIDFVL